MPLTRNGGEGTGYTARIREPGDLPTVQALIPLRAKEVADMIRFSGLARAARSHTTDLGEPSIARVRHVSHGARTVHLVIVACLLPLACIVALCIGSVHVPLAQVWSALAHPQATGSAQTIVVGLRLPRVLIAACVGAGLGVAGALLQALFRNPLVDPFVTGVSAGAALAAATALAAGIAFALIPAVAFVGGLACAAIVAALGSGDSPSGNVRLVLAGVAVSALASAVVTLILLQHAGADQGILAWLAGGINGRGWSEAALVSVYLAIGFALALGQVHAVNLLRLGEPAARGFGIRVDAARWRVLAIASLITAACVSVSGVVGFVGLMVPHAMRPLVSGDARWLLPASAFGGAVVVVLADLLARTVLAPAEIPLGVLLAFVGVPFFLLLARRPVEL
jgi:iron complex transport system permease protein